VFAQAQDKIALTANVGYGYNAVWQNFGEILVLSTFRAADNFHFNVGADYKINQLAAVKGEGRITFPVRKVALFLDNGYLYSAFFNDNLQQLNASLLFGVDTRYFTGKIGCFGRWLRPFHQADENSELSVFEPINLAYSFKGRIFPKGHKWNLSLEIANIGQFENERSTNPIFTLAGTAVVANQLSVHGLIIVKPAGMGHIAANFYQIQVQTGVTYVW
jgi:hypothetical protein